MRVLRVLTALTALAAVTQPATAQDDPFASPIVYKVPGMEQAVLKADLAYKSDKDDALRMDVYLPPGLAPDARLPAVIFIHGGYLPPDLRPRPKDWGVYRSYGRLMAASGLVGVTFNHRYYGWDDKSFGQSVGDVADAIAYVRANADSLHVDPQRIALWAFSGGGPHLTLALDNPPDYIRCIVSYYAILDLGPSVGRGTPPLTAEAAERYSPVRFITERNQSVPPVFIGRAGLDRREINSSIDDFITRAFANSVTIEVANHPAGRHGFDIYDDDDQSRDVIARTIEFIKGHLRADRLPAARAAQQVGALSRQIEQGEINAARKLAASLAAAGPEAKELCDRVLSEQALNAAGYTLKGEGKTRAAVEVLEWVVERNPESANAYDSLADAYEADKRIDDALAATEKALGLLDKITGIWAMRKDTIKRNIDARLARLRTAPRS